MSGVAGVSLSDDVLGLGKIFGQRDGTAECGSRPTFAGKGRNRYNDCIQRVQESKERVAMAQIEAQKHNHMQSEETQRMQGKPLPTKWLIIGGVGILLLIILLRR